MLLKINRDNPNPRLVKKAAQCLRDGGIIVYPTDTIYGLGCDIHNSKAVERICRIKGIDPKKSNLSFVCESLSHLSDYTRPFDRWVYRLMHKSLPGPYTFILKVSSEVPKLLKSKKKTVGIRVPDNNIARAIVAELGRPILSTSLKALDEDDPLEYITDPELIYEEYHKLVDIVVDGGSGGNQPSTVLDCTGDDLVVLRLGLGEVEE
ncbi:MAG: L-threonylcarbamoyladenylate synthase [Chitinophagales bacterium]